MRCALGRIRTCDTGFRRAVLYPLSYEGGDLRKTWVNTLSEYPPPLWQGWDHH